MATTKKPAAKKSAPKKLAPKKAVAKKSAAKKVVGKVSKPKSKAAPNTTIEIRLTKAQVAAAEKCVQTTGKVRLSIKEITKTKLPKIITARDVVVD